MISSKYFMKKTLFLLICCLLFISCERNREKAQYEKLFEQAQNMLENRQSRDSILMLLDSVKNPQILEEEKFAEFVLFRQQMIGPGRGPKDISIISDTLIFEVRDYFEKKGDWKKAAWANMASAYVYRAQKEQEKELNSFLKAASYAEKMRDGNLLGAMFFEIGNLYEKQNLFEEAIDNYRLALRHNSKEGKPVNFSAYYHAIGLTFLRMNQPDSARHYFDKVKEIAETTNNTTMIVAINQSNIGSSYLHSHDLQTAKENYLKTYKLATDEKFKMEFSTTLANIYYYLNMNDSARYYINQYLNYFENEGNNSSLSFVYRILSQIEEKESNYKGALNYHQAYSHFLAENLKEERDSDLRIFEKRYNYEQVQNEKNELLIERQYIYLLLLLSIIVIIAISFFLYWKMTKHKTHLLKEEAALLEAEQQISVLKNMAKDFNEKENTLRNEVIRYFNIIKKVALLNENKLFNNEKDYVSNILISQINKIVYGQKEGFNWDIFFNSINVLYDGIIERINEAYPQLDSTELKICYLSYASFSNSEIATLLGLALNTVQQKKSNIRKRIGVPEHGNLQDFLSQHLK